MGLRPLLSLGTGSMAQVVLALDETRRPFAVKLALPETAETPGLRALFLAEARAAQIHMHPHLVQCFATTRAPLSMVLQYVDGAALDDLVAASPPAPPLVASLLLDVARGLGEIARAGGCHGDLCPRNILVDRSGPAVITDFGAADDPEHGARFLGTVGYAAPEVVLGQRPDGVSDAFSFGVIAWELLRAERRFDPSLPEPTRLVASADTQLPDVHTARPDLAAFGSLCRALTQIDRQQRLHSWPEIINHLSLFPRADQPTVGAWVEAAAREELARRDTARNAVAARNGAG